MADQCHFGMMRWIIGSRARRSMVGMVVVFATLGTFTRVAFAAAVAGAAGAFGSFAVVAVEMIVVRHGVCFVLIIVVGGARGSFGRSGGGHGCFVRCCTYLP
jgi:hypothetical protein